MQDSSRYTGRCVCGSVRVAINGEAIATRQCWCRQCQHIAAGGATNNAIFHGEDVRIAGILAHSTWPAASGNALTHYFCPSCGTQIYAQTSARPHLKTVRLGIIDAPHDLAPQAIIWIDEAPAWAQFDSDLDQWPRQPPPPAAS